MFDAPTGGTFRVRQVPSLSALRPMLQDAVSTPAGMAQRFAQYAASGHAEIQSPWVGLTTDGKVVPGLFPLQPSGASTQEIKDAADAWLIGLQDWQRAAGMFPIDDTAWRAWSNIHVFVMRHGVLLDACSEEQRARGLALVRATLSAGGYETARNIMRLNDALGEVTGRFDEYGEWYYWLSVFGRPSLDEPWGWQIDGHHLIINCLVVGEQVVMTPAFMGSEPTAVSDGRHAGTRVFGAEEQAGLDFVRSLAGAARAKAMPPLTDRVLRQQRMDGRIQTAAFRDNARLEYAGLQAAELDSNGQRRLLELVELYVGRMRPDHARIKMDEVRRHLGDTHFLWVGGLEDDSTFYYRLHSPVILVEFDHLSGIAFDNEEPTRNHIHTVVRTPNGNDYGMDLLRQHYARHHQTPTLVSGG
ncbi:MAG TPA: DUF3500 domain-containing protein [Chloroflexota bacterium]|nr:DUF3500 domain-containing protein [Chloroflexota bacterium]